MDSEQNLGTSGDEYILSTVGDVENPILQIGQEFSHSSTDYLQFNSDSLHVSGGAHSFLIYFTAYIDANPADASQYLISTDSVI